MNTLRSADRFLQFRLLLLKIEVQNIHIGYEAIRDLHLIRIFHVRVVIQHERGAGGSQESPYPSSDHEEGLVHLVETCSDGHSLITEKEV